MYNYIYHLVDMYVLTPAANITLLTGLIWHGWIVYKWVVTLALVLSGTFYLGPLVTDLLEISEAKRLGALQDQYYTQGAIVGFWAGAVNSSLLVVAVIFSVYKPWKNIKQRTGG